MLEVRSMYLRSRIHVDRHNGPAILKSSEQEPVSRWSPEVLKTWTIDSTDSYPEAENGKSKVALQLHPLREQNIVVFGDKHEIKQNEYTTRSRKNQSTPTEVQNK